jgi:DNA-binding transcriptional ArsR family regulator
MHRDFSNTAALLSDPGRASILLALLGDVALPAGKLAMIANVTPQTASSHLSKLVNGRLLAVESQGRHRYYRIADVEVANVIEALLAITPHRKNAISHDRHDEHMKNLAYARTCYSHLAGELAVKITQGLQELQVIVPLEPRCYQVTKAGRTWFEQLGITVNEKQANTPRFARRCLDWTERRHHLAGHLGCAMLTRFRELRWIAPVRDSRAVRLTFEGELKLRNLLKGQRDCKKDGLQINQG